MKETSKPVVFAADERAQRRQPMAIALVICLAFSIWAASIASSKNINVLGYALLAFFLPLIGVIAAVAAKPGPAPEKS
jgi:hypothetical protein